LRAKRSNPAFLRKKEAGLLRRFAPLRKRFAFVAGNDGERPIDSPSCPRLTAAQAGKPQSKNTGGCLLSADGENNEIRILKRDDGSVVGSFGGNGRNAGQFHWVHAMAIDGKGNVYTAEVDTGKRIQKFKLTSDALR
jgi:hypothetical protein